MDPDGNTYFNVDRQDPEEDIFEDEIISNFDPGEDNEANEFPLVNEEGSDTIADPVIIPHSVISEQKNNKLKYTCLLGLIIILVIVTVVLTIDVEVEGEKELSNYNTIEEQLITFLSVRGISEESKLRSFTTAENSALTFLGREARDGEMPRLYADLQKNSQKVIERYVLAMLYTACQGRDWFHSYSFLSAEDHCEWNHSFEVDDDVMVEGVTKCTDDGYVQKLYLPENNLRCQDGLPDEIRHLKELTALVVRGNKIEGEFPTGLQELSNLSVLSLGYNLMEGSLPPWIGDLTQMSVLQLSNNNFGDDLPPTMSQLSDLMYLGMDDNFFTGNLDQYLGSLKKLEFIFLEDNEFTGTLDWLDNFGSLVYLDVSKNNLEGELPSSLVTHPRLAVADLNTNKFSGKLPNVNSKNEQLQLLSVHSNRLTGTIPAELSSIVNITLLDLSLNSFTGSIPTLSGTSSLRFLMTFGNNFTKQEMPSLGTLTSLVELSMKGNNIVGSIPNWMGDLTQMKWLDLDANELFGTIPSEIGKMIDLYALLLNRNDLDGTLPDTMTQLTDLELLLIDGNALIGDTYEICNRTDAISFFASDCARRPDGRPADLDCPCCTTCCANGDKSCNDMEWTSVHDPIIENGFARAYSFNHLAASPLYSKANDKDDDLF